ncbi:helix-turn-helix domain-containing protein [Pseudarthrobacter oxydans]|uniref:helix-turn-helix domain-containing protein n=1 Tax=Pseudarthrobacter oxydans TaxID=1671 RepID=UPI00381E4C57
MLAVAFSTRSDIDQKDLAKLVGVTEGRVSQVLHGDGNVHIGTLGRYMAALGYELELSAKVLDPKVPPLKMPTPRRSKRAARDRGPITLKYQLDTLRDSGVGPETIELRARPGETPPLALSIPVLITSGEVGEWPSRSAASQLIRDRASKALARQS